jgi:uncharacterized DUF497 family protein
MTYNWNEEKNSQLKRDRNISFEEIIICISEGKIVTVLEHPNKQKYPNQYIYLIEYKNYIYAVPYIIDEKEEEIFLKTIYPSREYTRKYLRREENEER